MTKAEAHAMAVSKSYEHHCEYFVFFDGDRWRATTRDPRLFQYSYRIPDAVYFDGEPA